MATGFARLRAEVISSALIYFRVANYAHIDKASGVNQWKNCSVNIFNQKIFRPRQ